MPESNFFPRLAGTQVPTLDEVLRLARGEIGIYTDVKHAPAETFVHALKRYCMVPHTVVYGYTNTFFQNVVRLDPQIMIMPEAGSAEFAQQLIDTFHPKIIAFSASDFKPSVLAVVKQAGDLIYVDRMGPTDNPSGWGVAVHEGADGIRTNYPGELVRYLRTHGYKR
jgi:glycerophosphoryl diester phosphodiesterase